MGDPDGVLHKNPKKRSRDDGNDTAPDNSHHSRYFNDDDQLLTKRRLSSAFRHPKRSHLTPAASGASKESLPAYGSEVLPRRLPVPQKHNERRNRTAFDGISHTISQDHTEGQDNRRLGLLADLGRRKAEPMHIAQRRAQTERIPIQAEMRVRARIEAERNAEEERARQHAEAMSNSRQQRSRRENGRGDGSGQAKPKSKPDLAKVRTWTDRSRSFNVEAQFLGLRDGKIHLHKMNGVKIGVPISKMSREDLEYVENLTGISYVDDKPSIQELAGV